MSTDLASRPVIGLDIGGTKLLAALVAGDGTVVAERRAPTPARSGPRSVLDDAARLVAELDVAPDAPLGVGSAGTIDPSTGVVRYATASLPGWAGTRLRDELAGRTGRRTVVDNDVNAAALGEWWVGAGRACSTVLLAAVGTGVGGGLVDAGVVSRGRGGAGLDIGHVVATDAKDPCGCGRTGHLEAVASGTALGRAYAEATGIDASGADVARRAQQGDEVARRVLERAGNVLGRTVAGVVGLLDPDVVVLAGGAAESLMVHASTAFEAERLAPYARCRLVPGELGPHAVAIGAARMALEDA
ncbi:ROK family protein [Phytoactinopolyspora halotolerans]|uniref:ROK family protein n=1 Tax=Phytoactinopolyspora halotolerans TaxID=1981512 RepID=A0A6L9SBS5_9ACTN|nr:ROK family protein [Phytoactinopolyspora halotolerans]NEE02001.1 ROK family protein [Phytoactinopolyspora halotolerans]